MAQKAGSHCFPCGNPVFDAWHRMAAASYGPHSPESAHMTNTWCWSRRWGTRGPERFHFLWEAEVEHEVLPTTGVLWINAVSSFLLGKASRSWFYSSLNSICYSFLFHLYADYNHYNPFFQKQIKENGVILSPTPPCYLHPGILKASLEQTVLLQVC